MGQAEDQGPFPRKEEAATGIVCPIMGIFHAVQFAKIQRPDAPPIMVMPVMPGCCKEKCEFWGEAKCLVKAALIAVPKIEAALHPAR
jgi:hypothetical protein